MLDMEDITIDSLLNVARRQLGVRNAVENPVSDSYDNVLEETSQFPESFDEPVGEPEGFTPIVLDDLHVETARFSSAQWFDKISQQVIVIGGQGGISSWFTFLAAKMFPRSIFTYDFDRVERVNLAGQLFSVDNIGMYKGDAIAHTIEKYCDYRSVYAVTERFTTSSSPSKIMVCGFDNMAARKLFYESWKYLVLSLREEERKECLFIDGRLAAESMQILCIVGDATWDMQKYEAEYLFSDEEADEAVCSYKQTAFMANMIAATMANLLVNHCANLCGGCRTIPFYTQYEADQMYLKIEGGV